MSSQKWIDRCSRWSRSSLLSDRNPSIALIPASSRLGHLLSRPTGCDGHRRPSITTTSITTTSITTTTTTTTTRTGLSHLHHPSSLLLRSPYSSRPLDSIDEDDEILPSIEPTGEPPKPVDRLQLTEQPQPGSQARSARSSSRRSSVMNFKTLQELYQKQIPITMLTAHDFATARMVGMSASEEIDRRSTTLQAPTGIDVCLCGDSLANVCLGYQSTTELGLEEFTYHLRAIRRGLDSLSYQSYYRIPLLVADLPFGTFESSLERGVQTATELIRTARVDGIKIEGGSELRPLIERLSSFGIPVIAHIGLTPQRATSLGGFKVQGHDCSKKAREIVKDAIELERSGSKAIVLEAVPIELVDRLKMIIKIPLIGIGAGPRTDGQVLVLSDLIGTLATSSDPKTTKAFNPKPKFVPNLSHHVRLQPDSNHPTFDLSIQIIRAYIHLVRTRQFPQIGLHTYAMKPEVLSELNRIGWTS